MAVLFLFLFGAASQAQIAQRNSRFMQVVVFDVRVSVIHQHDCAWKKTKKHRKAAERIQQSATARRCFNLFKS